MQRRTSVAIAAVTILGLGGVVAQQAVATPVASQAGSSLAAASTAEATRDGRALFEGLAFAQGSVAAELADSGKFVDVAALREKNSTAEQRQAVSGVLDRIQREQPEFFGSFSAKLRSGDPRQVESGVAEAGKILQSLASSKAANAGDIGTGTAQCATVVLAVNVLVAVNLGGAVNVAVAVNLQAAGNIVNALNFWSSPANGGSSLTKDEQIAGLTQVLAA
ncbi:sporulation delaying protein family toxin [Streptomyces sp. NBC_01343]|uniref:sporulation delaying protein family toxin n=1 Tax=Streptomyces sp. NBC_01343 TaxID=2903832 RepID=UPI002E0D984B|nr:sporulation delaying protein family toxin [Streptomyces sp. NBC_01343]